MLGFHWPELVIVLVIALLVFGPRKLPEIGSSIGRSIKEFRKATSSDHEHTKETIEKEQYELPKVEK